MYPSRAPTKKMHSLGWKITDNIYLSMYIPWKHFIGTASRTHPYVVTKDSFRKFPVKCTFRVKHRISFHRVPYYYILCFFLMCSLRGFEPDNIFQAVARIYEEIGPRLSYIGIGWYGKVKKTIEKPKAGRKTLASFGTTKSSQMA